MTDKHQQAILDVLEGEIAKIQGGIAFCRELLNRLPEETAIVEAAPVVAPKLSDNLQLKEIAVFYAKNIRTVRNWFEKVPGVIHLQRGKKQQPTLLIPPKVMRQWMEEHGVPGELIDNFLHRFEAPEQPPAKRGRISAQGRKRISDGQKKRWAKYRANGKAPEDHKAQVRQ